MNTIAEFKRKLTPGMVQAKVAWLNGATWKNLVTALDVFQMADNRARKA